MRKILVLVGIGAMALGGFTSCEPALGCGSVITANTVLVADITGCAGDALVVGADNITIDLAGHTVSSTDGIGIVLAGHDRVTLQGGVVRGAATGLSLTDASHLTVSEVAAHGADLAVRVERVTESRIVRSSAWGYYGFRLIDSHRNRVDRSMATGNVDTRNGLLLEGSHHNRITHGSFILGGDNSVVLRDSDHNVISDNDLASSNTGAISIARSDHNVVRRNFVDAESEAVTVWSSSGNVIEQNWGTGSRNGPYAGLRVEGSDRTTVRGNHFASVLVRSSTRTVLARNLIVEWSRDSDGIIVEADAVGTRLIGNIASGFGDDGIDVRAPGSVLTGNVTNDNGDLGIEAVVGVIDGGGNRAAGNGNPAQCLNVACR